MAVELSNSTRRSVPERNKNICPCKILHVNVHGSFVHNSQKGGNNPNTHQLISGWTRCRISIEGLFKKKKWNSDACYDMNKLCKEYAKQKQPDTKRTHIVWFHLYAMSRRSKSRDKQQMRGCPGPWELEEMGRDRWSNLFWGDENVLKSYGGDDGRTLWLDSKPLNYALLMGGLYGMWLFQKRAF